MPSGSLSDILPPFWGSKSKLVASLPLRRLRRKKEMSSELLPDYTKSHLSKYLYFCFTPYFFLNTLPTLDFGNIKWDNFCLPFRFSSGHVCLERILCIIVYVLANEDLCLELVFSADWYTTSETSLKMRHTLFRQPYGKKSPHIFN